MKKASVLWLVLIQWVLAIEWLHSGWGKWASPGFMNAIGQTLQSFASKNPYSWYVGFLNTTAIPNSYLFGNLIRSTEMSVGIIFALGGLALVAGKRLHPGASWVIAIACFAAALMNLNFFFAAGWTSPSTWGVNAVMALIELILGIYYVSNVQELA